MSVFLFLLTLKKIFAIIPPMWNLTEEERAIQTMSRQFAQEELAPQASHHDEEESFNLQAFKKLGEIGLLGITADPKYGGSGLGAMAATLVMEELGKTCASMTLSYLAHSILCVNNIDKNASAEQKEKYLPKLISGEWIGCMGMSEPEYGSDAIGLQTKAAKEGEHYLLSGTKMWITNAPYADIAYVYARTGEDKKQISTFILEHDSAQGFIRGKEIHKMGMRGSPTGELVFEQAKVAMDQRVGNENESLKHMMQNLDLERITISGISLGIAQACVDACERYIKEREQFSKPIGHFQLIQKMMAEMRTECHMMRSYLYDVARYYDRTETPDILHAAQVKLALPKMATKIALDAIQIHGGYGYAREFPVERYLRDAKLMEIGAGTNEIMIKIIGRELMNR